MIKIIMLPGVGRFVPSDVGRRNGGAAPAFKRAGQADGDERSYCGQVDQLARVLLDVEQAWWDERVAAGRLRLPRPASHLGAFSHADHLLLRQPRPQSQHRRDRGARLRAQHTADVVVRVTVAPRRLAVPRVHSPVLSRSCNLKKKKQDYFLSIKVSIFRKLISPKITGQIIYMQNIKVIFIVNYIQ